MRSRSSSRTNVSEGEEEEEEEDEDEDVDKTPSSPLRAKSRPSASHGSNTTGRTPDARMHGTGGNVSRWSWRRWLRSGRDAGDKATAAKPEASNASISALALFSTDFLYVSPASVSSVFKNCLSHPSVPFSTASKKNGKNGFISF